MSKRKSYYLVLFHQFSTCVIMDGMWELFEFASPSQVGAKLTDLQNKVNLMIKNNPGKLTKDLSKIFEWGT